MITLRSLATGVLAVALVGVGAGTAHARCASDDRPVDQQVAEAPVVFVGTVTAVDGSNVAAFRVEEIWKGGNVPDGVHVDGATHSEQRSWVVGTRYLVFPQATGVQPPLSDNACSPTREWTGDLAAFAPPTPDPNPPAFPVPTGDETEGYVVTASADTTWLLWTVAGLAPVAIAAVVILARRRRA